jgi:hypothetical protein
MILKYVRLDGYINTTGIMHIIYHKTMKKRVNFSLKLIPNALGLKLLKRIN